MIKRITKAATEYADNLDNYSTWIEAPLTNYVVNYVVKDDKLQIEQAFLSGVRYCSKIIEETLNHSFGQHGAYRLINLIKQEL